MKKCVKDLKVLSLFSGCGGMDLGFEGDFDVLTACLNLKVHHDWAKNKKGSWIRLPATRFKTVFANDIAHAARACWAPFFEKRGNKATDFHLESVVDLVKRHNQGENVFQSADVVTGGFPCQDFSVAGKRKGFNSHKAHHGDLLTAGDEPTAENRGKLYMWMRNIVGIVKPKVFVAENVKGLVSLAHAKKIIENDFRSIGNGGYLVMDARVLFAPDYGVPQSRERVIFIGFKKSAMTDRARKELSANHLSEEYTPYPQRTHSVQPSGVLKHHVNVRQVLADLPEPNNSKDLSQTIYSKAKWYGRHCQGQKEVDLEGLGPTIRSEHHGNIEFRRLSKKHGGRYVDELEKGMVERRLTVRECARIQTFPDNFTFVREKTATEKYPLSSSDGYRVIGNAVPPLLAFHIAKRLEKLWPKLFKKGAQ